MPRFSLFSSVALAVFLAAGAQAQRGMAGPAMHYDTTTVQTVTGKVVRFEAQPARGPAGTQVLLNTGTDSLVVHLGPSWNLQNNNFTLKPGDVIEVTGSKTIVFGKSAIIAAQVKKGSKTLKLRDSRGMPLWSMRGRPGSI